MPRPPVTEAAWLKFLSTPLAALEEYDVPIRMINAIEEDYGLYVRDLQGVDLSEMMEMRNCAARSLGNFQRGIKQLFADIVQQEKGDDSKC